MSLLPVLDANGSQVSYLAAGYAGQSTGQFSQNQYLVLARYHLDGSLDTTFGTNGSGGPPSRRNGLNTGGKTRRNALSGLQFGTRSVNSLQ